MNSTYNKLLWSFEQLNPEEFDNYAPSGGVQLTASQVRKLQGFIRLLPLDKNMLLYFWRFVFGMDISTIRRYAKIDYANGIIEVLRFACKRYLDLESPISNSAMAKVFKLLIPEFDIVLVSLEKGICWFSGNNIDAGVIHEVIEAQEQC